MSIPLVEAESLSGSVVKIVSPTSSTYDRRVLLLNVTFCYGGLRLDLTYNLDGVMAGSIPMGEYQPPNNEFHLVNTVYAWVKLPELSDGPHSVTVTLVAHVHYSGGGKPGAPFQPTSPGSSEYSATWSDTVRFSVYSDIPYGSQPQPAVDSTPPKISNISVHNQTYPSPDVPLNFTLSGSTSRIAYSLDGGDNVTIGGNTTLHGLSAGKHNVTIYCWDDAGNVGASQTVAFNVVDGQPSVSASATSTADQETVPETKGSSQPWQLETIVEMIVIAVLMSFVAALFFMKKSKR
jgi:hypothetical protein